MPRAERKRRGSRELLELVHLDGFADKRPHELSGGMRQRVALARALAQDADVLLMDEPFGALDAMTRDMLHDELERIWQQTGLTIVFVTHNVREAARLGDRIVLLTSRPGRVAAEFAVDIDRARGASSRPRSSALAAEITDRLREEVRPPWPSLSRRAAGDRQRAELAGLDALEPPADHRRRSPGIWVVALAEAARHRASSSVVWQWSCGAAGSRSTSCPPPAPCFDRLWTDMHTAEFWTAIGITMRRAVIGFALALVIGVARPGRGPRHASAGRRRLADHRAADDAVDRLVPAGHPAVQLTEAAIMFVVVLGAAPSIANGVITGVDHIPPILLRAGRVLGAKGFGALPLRDPARRAAVVRRRAEAGLGVRLAQPDGRRAARHHRQGRRSAPSWRRADLSTHPA